MSMEWKKACTRCDRCGRLLEVWVDESLTVDDVMDGDIVRCVTCKQEGEVVGTDVDWTGRCTKGECGL